MYMYACICVHVYKIAVWSHEFHVKGDQLYGKRV